MQGLRRFLLHNRKLEREGKDATFYSAFDPIGTAIETMAKNGAKVKLFGIHETRSFKGEQGRGLRDQPTSFVKE